MIHRAETLSLSFQSRLPSGVHQMGAVASLRHDLLKGQAASPPVRCNTSRITPCLLKTLRRHRIHLRSLTVLIPQRHIPRNKQVMTFKSQVGFWF